MMKKLTSRSNPVCVHLKELGRSKSYRDDCGEFLCDGIKLLSEAISSGTEVKTVLTSQMPGFSLPSSTQVYLAKNDLIDSVSPLKNSQGLLFSCNIKKQTSCDYQTGTHILLDNVQDPGNVGTIIRSACAFKLESLIITGGSADIYNPKAIRASMGSIFKQRVCNMDISGIYKLKKTGLKIIGASSDTNCTNIESADLRNSVIILGNEGQGISEDLQTLCDELINIPLSRDCDSLNVAIAASIIMWEAVKH